MELFLILVLSAAFVGVTWHAVRWALGMDKKYPRPMRLSRKARARLEAQFQEIIDDLRKDTQ